MGQAGLLQTQHDDEQPPGSSPMSLVFIGSAEDGFVDAGRTYAVDGLSRIRFGRSLDGSRIQLRDETEGVRIGIPHPWVSGEHCQVELQWHSAAQAQMSLHDLQSRNGTLLENRPVVGWSGLRTDQVFEVGRTFWMLRSAPPDDQEHFPGTVADPMYEPIFATLRDTLIGVATSDVPVLVLGETGTGKERLARALHAYSGRRGQFIPVRLGAYPEDDLPQVLVGSRRSSVPAFVDRAEGGTLFLTDIASVSLRTQARLRSLLSRIVEGRGRKSRDVRLVSASAVDLRQLVDERRFRPELYSRLAGVELALPPLRSRRDRLGALIRRFADSHPEAELKLSTRAFRYALAHRWPYNVRELRHALSAALTIASREGRINLAVLEEVLREKELPPTTTSNNSS